MDERSAGAVPLTTGKDSRVTEEKGGQLLTLRRRESTRSVSTRQSDRLEPVHDRDSCSKEREERKISVTQDSLIATW
jgi:hypothetical protein